MNMAVDWCIENDILKDILSKNRAEVKDMCLTEFDAKAYEDLVREAGREEGIKESENKFSRLIILLNNAGRAQDIISAAADHDRLQELYAEFNLNEKE